jgi:4a-hydroxytetrahydrobiopterin dehydratase
MAILPRADIDAALRDLPGWQFAGNALVKEFTFAGFPDAVAFVTRLVPGSEAADHHPDLTVSYRRVTVSFTTHSEGGVTAKDLAGARLADSCA